MFRRNVKGIVKIRVPIVVISGSVVANSLQFRSKANRKRLKILSNKVNRKKEWKILFAIFKLLSIAWVSSLSNNWINFPPLFNEKQNEANESIFIMKFPIIRISFKTVLGASSLDSNVFVNVQLVSFKYVWKSPELMRKE